MSRPVLPAGWLLISFNHCNLGWREYTPFADLMEKHGGYRHADGNRWVIPAQYVAYERERLIRKGIPEEAIQITHTQPPKEPANRLGPIVFMD